MRFLSRRGAVFLFFVITGVPIALLTYLAIAVSTSSAVNQAEKAAADSAQASAVFIQQRFQNVADQLAAVAEGSLSPQMAEGSSTPSDLGALEVQLEDLTRSRSGITTAFVTDPRGRLIAIAPGRNELVGRYFSGDDWYRGIRSGGTSYVAGLSATAAQQDLNSVAIAAAVDRPAKTGPTSLRLGYLVGIYSLDQIQAFVDDFARTRATNLTIVDRDGYLLAAPGLAPGTVASWEDNDRLMREALAGHANVSQVVVGGTGHLAAYAPVPGFGWVVVADVPASLALRDADRLRSTVLGIAGVLGLVLVGGLSSARRSCTGRSSRRPSSSAWSPSRASTRRRARSTPSTARGRCRSSRAVRESWSGPTSACWPCGTRRAGGWRPRPTIARPSCPPAA